MKCTYPVVDPRRARSGQILVNSVELDIGHKVGAVSGTLVIVEETKGICREVLHGLRLACEREFKPQSIHDEIGVP